MFLGHFLVNISTTKVTRLFKCCFLNVEATLMNICWLEFHFQLTIKVETTLGHRLWIDVILSMLFQRCFVNVETTLVHRRWIDVNLSMLFQRCFVNIETTLMDVNINVVSTLIQRWCVCWDYFREMKCQQGFTTGVSH